MTSTDPPYITSMEHFESMPHQEIYRKAQQIDPSALALGALTWLEVAASITDGFPVATAVLDSVLNDGRWGGAAANAAVQSARSIAASATEFAEVMGVMSARLAAVAAAGEVVKLGVVPPNDKSPVAMLTALISGTSLMDTQRMEEELRREAVLVMNTVYEPCYRPAGNGVPPFPAAPRPVHTHSAPGPSTGRTTATTASSPQPAVTQTPATLQQLSPIPTVVPDIEVEVGDTAPPQWTRGTISGTVPLPDGQIGVTAPVPDVPDQPQAGVTDPED